MKLCISNLAWDVKDDGSIAEVLARYGVEAIEIAPTKIWSDPVNAADSNLAEYRAWWEARGIGIRAMQALLFGHPEMTIFGEASARDSTLAYLAKIACLGSKVGARVLVFGSPKNRAIGNLPVEEAMPIAIEFFRAAGEAAHRAGVTLAIEPNPPQYACDFIRTVHEAVELVRAVNHPGFRLHLDASSMILNSEDFDSAIDEAADWMVHFHISDPHLTVVGAHPAEHRRIAAGLRRIGWAGYISIEMRNGQLQPDRLAVERALEFAREVYLA